LVKWCPLPDQTYTTPIYLTGDMVAALSGQPTNNGNPGDANFGIVLPDATALGSGSQQYRLVWSANLNTTATEFSNGQFWTLQSYNAAADTDGDAQTGSDGWSNVAGYDRLTPKNDLVSGLGDGDEYIVFSSESGRHLLYDINGGLPATPTTLIYAATTQNGDLTQGDNDGRLDFYDSYSAVCFCDGTLIETDRGPRAIESLQPGDKVLTRDNGFQPLRWIGQRRLGAADLAAAPNLRPVRIKAGALGPGCPATDLAVSPQHRLLVRSRIARRMFGADEVLVAARHLCGLPGIAEIETATEVCYLHMLFDRHEIVQANGAPAESLHTGPMALRSLSPQARHEIFALFPELRGGTCPRQPARPLIEGRRGRQMAQRHLRNAAALVQARLG